jgi:hypothetical protein
VSASVTSVWIGHRRQAQGRHARDQHPARTAAQTHRSMPAKPKQQLLGLIDTFIAANSKP